MRDTGLGHRKAEGQGSCPQEQPKHPHSHHTMATKLQDLMAWPLALEYSLRSGGPGPSIHSTVLVGAQHSSRLAFLSSLQSPG